MGVRERSQRGSAPLGGEYYRRNFFLLVLLKYDIGRTVVEGAVVRHAGILEVLDLLYQRISASSTG